MFSQVLKTTTSALMLLSLAWASMSFASDKNAKISSILPQVTVEEAADLRMDSQQAIKKQVPVLLFFSMHHCPFCIEVEEDYLKPMLRNAEYDKKVIIRKVRIDSSGELRDFNGEKVDAEEYGDKYHVSMVPTLVLVNAQGKQISPSIVGIANAHYYSGELDEAIDASLQKIRSIAKK